MNKKLIKKALNIALLYAKDSMPELPKGHICGPESNCDGLCQEAYYVSESIKIIESAIKEINQGE